MMKKVIKSMLMAAICVSAAMSVTSCSDDNDDPGMTGPIVTPTENMTNEGYYKGDIYGNGSGNLWVNFISTTLEWNDSEEDYTGTGRIVCLDFNTLLADNPDFPALAEGEYTADDTHELNTFNIDGDSYVTSYNPSGVTSREVVGGSVKVKKDGDLTVIEAQLKLDDGADYTFSYVGKLNIINRTGEGQMSNLTSDVTVEALTQGVAMYFGQTFTETSDLYMVVIAGDDYDLDENYGNSPSVMLGLNVTPGSTTGIPSGRYTLIDAMEADDYDVNTAMSGVYEMSLGGFFGTWYFHTIKGFEASMKTGYVDVTNKGNDSYDITFSMIDGYGHTVSGSYSGTLPVENLAD